MCFPQQNLDMKTETRSSDDDIKYVSEIFDKYITDNVKVGDDDKRKFLWSDSDMYDFACKKFDKLNYEIVCEGVFTAIFKCRIYRKINGIPCVPVNIYDDTLPFWYGLYKYLLTEDCVNSYYVSNFKQKYFKQKYFSLDVLTNRFENLVCIIINTCNDTCMLQALQVFIERFPTQAKESKFVQKSDFYYVLHTKLHDRRLFERFPWNDIIPAMANRADPRRIEFNNRIPYLFIEPLIYGIEILPATDRARLLQQIDLSIRRLDKFARFIAYIMCDDYCTFIPEFEHTIPINKYIKQVSCLPKWILWLINISINLGRLEVADYLMSLCQKNNIECDDIIIQPMIIYLCITQENIEFLRWLDSRCLLPKSMIHDLFMNKHIPVTTETIEMLQTTHQHSYIDDHDFNQFAEAMFEVACVTNNILGVESLIMREVHKNISMERMFNKAVMHNSFSVASYIMDKSIETKPAQYIMNKLKNHKQNEMLGKIYRRFD